MSRFDYVKYDEIATMHQAYAKRLMVDVEMFMTTIGSKNDPRVARAKALALTKLEECYMWIGKAVRDDQIARNGAAELQESRGNE